MSNNSKWKDNEEDILKKWADKGACYKIMHDRAHKKLWCLNAWFSIPVIIFSTLAGTGNFSQGSFSSEWKQPLILSIGAINLLSAILATISQFLGVTESMEGHKTAAIAWDKFSRKIQVELSKDDSSRQSIKQFLPSRQEEYDRLIENGPNLPTDIIRWFRTVIDTGDYNDNNHGCSTCCYECFCFPCGYDCRIRGRCCTRNIFCKKIKTNEEELRRKRSIQIELENIEKPEILGRLKSTKIFGGKQNPDEIESGYSIYNK